MNKINATLLSVLLTAFGSSSVTAQTTWLITNTQEVVELKTPVKNEEDTVRAAVRFSHSQDSIAPRCVAGDFGRFYEDLVKNDKDCSDFKKESSQGFLKFSAVCDDVKTTGIIRVKPTDSKMWTGEFSWVITGPDRDIKIKGAFSAIDSGQSCVSGEEVERSFKKVELFTLKKFAQL